MGPNFKLTITQLLEKSLPGLLESKQVLDTREFPRETLLVQHYQGSVNPVPTGLKELPQTSSS